MYIDPGAGSILFQALAAGVVAVLASAGRIRRALRALRDRLRGQ